MFVRREFLLEEYPLAGLPGGDPSSDIEDNGVGQRVNLDAMIQRENFSREVDEEAAPEIIRELISQCSFLAVLFGDCFESRIFSERRIIGRRTRFCIWCEASLTVR